MSISVDYVRHLLDNVYNISREKLSEVAEHNCLKITEELKIKIKTLLKECGYSRKSDNDLYQYFSKIKSTRNYLRIINYLNEMCEFIESKKSLNESEKKMCEDLDSYINVRAKLNGFSTPSIMRLLKQDEPLDELKQQKLEIILEYVFLPETKNDKNIRERYYLATRSFLIENKKIAERTSFRDAYQALILEPKDYPDDCECYMRCVFEIVKCVDHCMGVPLSYENKLREILFPFVERACRNCKHITPEVQECVWNSSMSDLEKEIELYQDICQNREAMFASPFFKCIGLYHISHAFFEKRDSDIEFERVALKLFSWASTEFMILLHPASRIAAPCGLLGDHIFVGAGCIIESGCYIEGNTVISECIEGNAEADDRTIKIASGTTIKKGAMITGVVSIGKDCVIGEDTIVMNVEMEDNQVMIRKSSAEIWTYDDYIRYGGYSYGRKKV